MLFTGTHIHKLDRKGRVSVPKRFRATLERETFAGIYLYQSHKEAALEGCGESHMDRIAASIDELAMFSDEADDLADTILGASHMLPFDGEGRIILPPELIEFARIEDQVAFVGRGRTFRIWNPEIFKPLQDASRTRTFNRGSTLKLKPASDFAPGSRPAASAAEIAPDEEGPDDGGSA
ncbi:MraZ protein [Thalassospira sp. MBR-102]|uniref:division/cell wall cluster transcriptional repressor MraZ n=1 Tax=Thalassospira TaxID=168934 RepID=UPI000DEDF577|nr:division/cell wall cluster transcriptional repressor MraZ [Thalassospira xiamenensis]RCK36159.1 cell division protein MraZ [Thalassospira xiamenensis]